jgi:hypothetical protein
MMGIACQQLRKSYHSRQGSTLALHNVSFQVAALGWCLGYFWADPVCYGGSLILGLPPFMRFLKLRSCRSLFVRQPEVAHQTLQGGGVVGIVPDGAAGDSPSIVRPFHGRQRHFRTGFAELALLTQSSVLVVIGEMQPGQKIKFRVLGPLDAGDASMSHEARLKHFVNQYLVHLDQLWRTMPWMISWEGMQGHLAYPPVTE